MSRKTWGRLAGSTQASTVLADLAAANTLTPFVAALPGSKLHAYGEGGTSAVWNRALGAVQANVEHIQNVLDGVALRDDVIAAADDTNQTYGSAGLTAVGMTTTAVNLYTPTTAGAEVGATPVYWVYVGLHKSRLKDFVRLYRHAKGGLSQYDLLDPATASSLNVVTPVDVVAYNGAVGADASYFPDQAYVLTGQTTASPHAFPDYIPGVKRLRPSVAPYNGSQTPDAVSTWSSDGCYLTNYSWRKLFARPGCFVEVSGSTYNDGVYRAVAFNQHETPALSKVVLTRGGLHRVTVGSAAAFTVGSRVSWRAAPDNSIDTAQPLWDNHAYVMYKVGNDLYLGDLPGEEDYPAGALTYGQKVGTGVPAGQQRTLQHGSVGLPDQEAGSTQNWSLPVGTRLCSIDDDFSLVTAVLPAGYPLVLRTDGTLPGVAYVCSPPGFVVCPRLVVTTGHTSGGSLAVHCKTLSTVRERLLSAGAGPNKQIVHDTADGLGFGKFDQALLRAFVHAVRVGSDVSSSPTTPFAPTAQVLGENLWRLTLTDGGSGLTLQNRLEDQDPTYETVPVALAFLDVSDANVNGSAQSRATPVCAVGNVVVLKDVSRSLWADWQYVSARPAIAVGSTCLYHGVTYTVDSIQAQPTLLDAAGAAMHVTEGLDAAYNAALASAQRSRGGSRGSRIALALNKPFTLLLKDAAAQVGVQLRGTQTSAQLLRWDTFDLTRRVAVEVLDDALAFLDTNTLLDAVTPIPFSTALAGNRSLDTQLPQNLLGAINNSAGLPEVLDAVLSYSILSGCAVTIGTATPAEVGPPAVDAVLRVNIAAGTTLGTDGRRVEWAEQLGLEVPLNSTFFIVFGGNFFYVAYTLAGDDLAAAAWVSTNASAITALVDVRLFPKSLNRMLDINVGGPDAQFGTLYAAVQFLNYMHKAGTGALAPVPAPVATRSWRILLRGSTVETQVIKFLTGNVLIQGLGMGATPGTAPASVSWSGEQMLFDINGQSDITFRDLSLVYDDVTAPPDPALSRIAFDTSTNTTDNTRILIEHVRVSATVGSPLHGYIGASTAKDWVDCQFVDCVFTGASDFGIDVSAQNLQICRCKVTGLGTAQAANGGIAGIRLRGLGVAMGSWVTDCRVAAWGNFGIRLVGMTRTHVRGCLIYGVTATGTTPDAYGVYVDVDSTRVTVTECTTDAVDSAAGLAAGVYIAGALRVNVSNNDLQSSGVDAPSTAGVKLGATAQYCIVEGNQTNDCGISDLGVDNSIGAMNRDDA